MSKWIKIRVKDFYKDAVGELEYTYVTREVYEALVDTFRKEAHAQEMRDIRHTYFFEGMTYRQIAAKEGVGEKNIRESINGAVKKIKKYFD